MCWESCSLVRQRSFSAFFCPATFCRPDLRQKVAGQKNRAPERSLDIACHISVKNHPDEQGAVDALQFFEHVGIRHFDFDPEVLLLVYIDRFGESKSGHRVRLPVADGMAVVYPGPGWEEIGRHLNHDFFADEERSDGVIDELVDELGDAFAWIDLKLRRHISFR